MVEPVVSTMPNTQIMNFPLVQLLVNTLIEKAKRHFHNSKQVCKDANGRPDMA